MSYMPDLQTTILIKIATGLITAYLAIRRGRRPVFWFFIGFFFDLLGLIAFFFVPTPKKKLIPVPLTGTKTVPEPYLFGPADKFWYYLDESREQVGPMSHSGITNAWKGGKLSPATFIWHEDLPEWKPLEELVRIQE